ncbi:NAD(P)-dependent oxidoreductase [Burkholderia singularis]|uniref:2-hydroxy-3-oxopropionate reductase n=1 Tax=Burkholderia singularis TaxID=1503053 RepID=A0A238H9N7_9BURK|nr:NAD(P)-dependent oxidoreductase [Burkholderia singularis]SMG02191.1 2-hydroxy-3-oxopropionate reductase [Burkholderia singularis]
MKLGFIGLGTMGKPMAANLVKAGYEVRVWNRSSPAIEELNRLGAEVAETPADVAKVDVLFSMLSDDDAVRSILVDGRVIDEMQSGAIHVNMATVSVALAAEQTSLHQQRGIGYIAAPVLGRPDVAASGKLNILAAGRFDLIDKVRPLLVPLGQKIWQFGENPAQANAVKLSVNLMIASAIESMAEGAALAESHGISTEDFIELIGSTLFSVPVYQGYGRLMAEKNYQPAGFKLALGLKDIRLALQAGEAARVPLPFAGVLRENLLDGLAHEQGEHDWASLFEVARRRAALD